MLNRRFLILQRRLLVRLAIGVVVVCLLMLAIIYWPERSVQDTTQGEWTCGKRQRRDMPAVVLAEGVFRPGEPIVVEGLAPHSLFGEVFEDDGHTGYFLWPDFRHQEQRIVDAPHICNVQQVGDREVRSVL